MVDSIKVIGRKTSGDPLQEHLRANKQNWNKAMSAFIGELIAFKRGMNGYGDPRVGIPPSKIQDPLPMEFSTSLDHLSSEYEHLVSEALNIFNEQNEYSQHRKKSQMPIQANIKESYLSKEASWWGSRLKTLFQFGDETKSIRKALLTNAVDVKNNIKKLDSAILSGDENSIIKAISYFRLALDSYIVNFVKPFNKFIIDVDNIGNLEDDNKELPSEFNNNFVENKQTAPIVDPIEISNTDDPALFWKEHMNDIYFLNSLASIASTESLKKRLQTSASKLERLSANIQLMTQEYKDNTSVLNDFKKEYLKNLDAVNVEFGTGLDSFEKIFSVKKAYSTNNDELKKLADNAVSRWVKRKLLNINWFSDQTKQTKSEITELINDFEKMLDSVMNILEEKNLNPVNLVSGVSNLNAILRQIGEKISFLARRHNEQVNIENIYSKKKSNLKEINRVELNKLQHLIEKL